MSQVAFYSSTMLFACAAEVCGLSATMLNRCDHFSLRPLCLLAASWFVLKGLRKPPMPQKRSIKRCSCSVEPVARFASATGRTLHRAWINPHPASCSGARSYFAPSVPSCGHLIRVHWCPFVVAGLVFSNGVTGSMNSQQRAPRK